MMNVALVLIESTMPNAAGRVAPASIPRVVYRAVFAYAALMIVVFTIGVVAWLRTNRG